MGYIIVDSYDRWTRRADSRDREGEGGGGREEEEAEGSGVDLPLLNREPFKQNI